MYPNTMLKCVSLVLFLLLMFSCNMRERPKHEFSLVGSWFTDLNDGYIFFSPTYAEVYVTDSVLFFYNDKNRDPAFQKYFVKGDSIFKEVPDENVLEPFWRIEGYRGDSLWLVDIYENEHKIAKRNEYPWPVDSVAIWIRLPRGERGFYDLAPGSPSSSDDLLRDFNRRKFKYLSVLGDSIHIYDSLFNTRK